MDMARAAGNDEPLGGGEEDEWAVDWSLLNDTGWEIPMIDVSPPAVVTASTLRLFRLGLVDALITAFDAVDDVLQYLQLCQQLWAKVHQTDWPSPDPKTQPKTLADEFQRHIELFLHFHQAATRCPDPTLDDWALITSHVLPLDVADCFSDLQRLLSLSLHQLLLAFQLTLQTVRGESLMTDRLVWYMLREAPEFVALFQHFYRERLRSVRAGSISNHFGKFQLIPSIEADLASEFERVGEGVCPTVPWWGLLAPEILAARNVGLPVRVCQCLGQNDTLRDLVRHVGAMIISFELAPVHLRSFPLSIASLEPKSPTHIEVVVENVVETVDNPMGPLQGLLAACEAHSGYLVPGTLARLARDAFGMHRAFQKALGPRLDTNEAWTAFSQRLTSQKASPTVPAAAPLALYVNHVEHIYVIVFDFAHQRLYVGNRGEAFVQPGIVSYRLRRYPTRAEFAAVYESMQRNLAVNAFPNMLAEWTWPCMTVERFMTEQVESDCTLVAMELALWTILHLQVPNSQALYRSITRYASLWQWDSTRAFIAKHVSTVAPMLPAVQDMLVSAMVVSATGWLDAYSGLTPPQLDPTNASRLMDWRQVDRFVGITASDLVRVLPSFFRKYQRAVRSFIHVPVTDHGLPVQRHYSPRSVLANPHSTSLWSPSSSSFSSSTITLKDECRRKRATWFELWTYGDHILKSLLQRDSLALTDDERALVAMALLFTGNESGFVNLISSLSVERKRTLAKHFASRGHTLIDALLYGKSVMVNRARHYNPLPSMEPVPVSAACLVAVWELVYLEGEPLSARIFAKAMGKTPMDRHHEVLPTVTLDPTNALLNAKATLYSMVIAQEYAMANAVTATSGTDRVLAEHVRSLVKIARSVQIALKASTASELGIFYDTIWRKQLFPVILAANASVAIAMPTSSHLSSSMVSSACVSQADQVMGCIRGLLESNTSGRAFRLGRLTALLYANVL